MAIDTCQAVARHVMDTLFEPSCLESLKSDVLRRGEQYLPL
jgi:hypothetical protein